MACTSCKTSHNSLWWMGQFGGRRRGGGGSGAVNSGGEGEGEMESLQNLQPRLASLLSLTGNFPCCQGTAVGRFLVMVMYDKFETKENKI